AKTSVVPVILDNSDPLIFSCFRTLFSIFWRLALFLPFYSPEPAQFACLTANCEVKNSAGTQLPENLPHNPFLK
ncbi:MAG: hypothetical protein EBT20_21675, partial [Alphaproteobacteria bacterium]|nr:hypothetical protein [Alphaproteobacteria bacterium]